MAIRPIVRLGHPALRIPAAAIDPARIPEPEIQNLIDDLIASMLAAGAVGLCAPQLAVGEQLFVYLAVGADGQERENAPPMVLINPMLEPESGELVYDWEGCLSVPDLRGLVPRRPAVRVHALDRHGEILDYRVEGYEARIVQHEFDHLNGVVFLDRMRDLRSLAFGAEWEEFLTTDDDGPAVGC